MDSVSLKKVIKDFYKIIEKKEISKSLLEIIEDRVAVYDLGKENIFEVIDYELSFEDENYDYQRYNEEE